MGKKNRKKQQDDDWMDEAANDLEALRNEMGIEKTEVVAAPVVVAEKKKKKTKGGKKAESDDEDDEADAASPEPVQKVTSGFAALAVSDDDDDDNGSEEEHEQLKLEAESPKKEIKGVTEDAVDDNDEDEEEDGAPVIKLKTAAQKKAEKKERERLKKEAEKKKKAEKKKRQREKKLEEEKKEAQEEDEIAAALKEIEGDKPKEAEMSSAKTKDAEPATPEAESVEDKATNDEPAADKENPNDAEDGSDGGSDEESSSSSKKKKKKKKKKTAEEKKTKGAKPKGGVALLRAKMEAQRLEEERIQAEIEAEKQRLKEEQERLEAEERAEEEKRLAKKQKEKERKERLKAEGKYMTKAERQRKALAEQKLKQMQELGILDLPVDGDGKKKKVVYTKKKKKQPNRQTPEPKAEPELETKPEVKEEPEEEEKPAEPEVEEEEEIKDAWDETSEEEEEDEEEEKEEEDKPRNKEDKEAGAKKQESKEEEEEEDSAEEEDTAEQKAIAAQRIKEREAKIAAEKSLDDLRSPIVAVLGHVDTGKTKLLDKIRRSNVQTGEAGGITQQIGATYFPTSEIEKQTRGVKKAQSLQIKVPGLLIIDTPGHESFANLRTRGSSLCDIAILVVDIMHGLEPQTIESIELLRSKKAPFIVALNKVDRLNEWRATPGAAIQNALKKQKHPSTNQEFETRTEMVKLQLAEKGINSQLYWENKDIRTFVNIVPTSAHTGEGIPDLLYLLVHLTQKMLAHRIAFTRELNCTVLEVKVVDGLGTTIDVILANGVLKEGSTIVLCGLEGPIVTTVRSLLMPEALKELRVKNAYKTFKEIKAAQGVKIAAKDLEKTVAGTQLLVADHPDEIEYLKEEAQKQLAQSLQSMKTVEQGVVVQASTLGSLEALMEFLKQSKIPVSQINIGPVHKKDITKASIQLDKDKKYAVILAFDVPVDRDAQQMADQLGIKIFTAVIIYHLFDSFTAHMEELKQRMKEEHKYIATFPCRIKIIPGNVFNARDPIIIGVKVVDGILKEGTPLCVPNKGFVNIGTVSSLEFNHEAVETAKKGQEVCVKIEPLGDKKVLVGRHFEETDEIVSRISRKSIEACKAHFRDELGKDDWKLMIQLKKVFEIL